MKLVEILAKGRDKLNCPIDLDFEWFSATQVYDGDVCFSLNEKGTFQAHRDLNICKADDWVEAIVTRAQWEAERARILAESQPERARILAESQPERDPEIAEIVEKACGKRSKEDQALWDKVASESLQSYLNLCDLSGAAEVFTERACSMADAFMAERAKRMKG